MRPHLCMFMVVPLALALVCVAQSTPVSRPQAGPPRPKKVLTPEQVAYQAAMKTYEADRAKLRTAAQDAFVAEGAREKAVVCADANTTYDNNICLAHEVEITEGNLKKFSRALRAMLALPEPQMPGMDYPMMGPSGPEATPATSSAAFDVSERAAEAYARAECGAVDVQWRGGTIVNAVVLECELRQSRNRLHELDTAYSEVLHPH